MTCYSDLPLDSVIWCYSYYNHTYPDFCNFYDNHTGNNSPFANSTYNTAGNGKIHQLFLPLDEALNGVYSCGIYPVRGSAAVQLQNMTFYGKLYIGVIQII